MCMGSNPGQPGKKIVKNDLTNQVKFELSTLRHYLSIYIYIKNHIKLMKANKSLGLNKSGSFKEALSQQGQSVS